MVGDVYLHLITKFRLFALKVCQSFCYFFFRQCSRLKISFMQDMCLSAIEGRICIFLSLTRASTFKTDVWYAKIGCLFFMHHTTSANNLQPILFVFLSKYFFYSLNSQSIFFTLHNVNCYGKQSKNLYWNFTRILLWKEFFPIDNRDHREGCKEKDSREVLNLMISHMLIPGNDFQLYFCVQICLKYS